MVAGRLEQVLPQWSSTAFGLYAMYPPNRNLTARVLQPFHQRQAGAFGCPQPSEQYRIIVQQRYVLRYDTCSVRPTPSVIIDGYPLVCDPVIL